MQRIDNQTDIINVDTLVDLIEHSKYHDQPILIDWVNRTIRITSNLIPTMRNGKRLILSNGPCSHRDILFQDSTGSEDNELYVGLSRCFCCSQLNTQFVVARKDGRRYCRECWAGAWPID